jgi:hypothetical protein
MVWLVASSSRRALRTSCCHHATPPWILLGFRMCVSMYCFVFDGDDVIQGRAVAGHGRLSQRDSDLTSSPQ